MSAAVTGPGTFFSRMNSLASCLKDHSDLGDGSGGNIVSNELPDAISQFMKSHPQVQLSDELKCYARSFGSAGPLRSCNASIEFQFKMADQIDKVSGKIGFNSPDSQAALALHRKSVDMMTVETGVGEAAADYVASQALDYAMKDPRYLESPLSNSGDEDRVAEGLTAGLGSWCLSGDMRPGSSHPTALLRASIIAQGSLRKTLGCRAPASGPGYPEFACRLEGEPK